jgi:hypothetical protein
MSEVSALYATALEAFRSASQAHRAVTLEYRAGKISAEAFLASRAKLEAAGVELDVAERDELAIATHREYLEAEGAVSLRAALPSGRSVEIFRDGRVA